MDKLSMFKYFIKKIVKVAKKIFARVLWHLRPRSFLDLLVELFLLWLCIYSAVVNASAAELPEQIVNAAQLPEQSDPERSDPEQSYSEQLAATPVIDYTEKFDNLESSLNMLSEYIDNIQADLTDLKGSVSGNDIDYSDQLDDLQDKLTDLSDDVAAILESTTVSENTVSENSLLDTPLNSLPLFQQLGVLLIVILMFFMVVITIAFWL